MSNLQVDPIQTSRFIAERVREARRSRGWSVKDLAARCEQAGYSKLTADALYVLEGPRPRSITVDEWLVLARVLEVPPLALILSEQDVSDIAIWLDTNPSEALEAAAKAAELQIPGHLGVCVAAVLSDHSGDKYPDPNIHELAHALLVSERQLTSVPMPLMLSR